MDAPRVRRNDYGTLAPPALDRWRPTRTVSVIIPAYQQQELLDLTLAGLARQTYPDELLEVIVVDDGSEPKLELPPLAPPHTRLVRAADHSTGWGRANALHVGARLAEGEILHWLDADLVTFPEHVAAQARWHHLTGDAVTLGYKRFVPHGPWPTPQQVYDGPAAALFPDDACEPHGYVEELIDATGGLRHADHLAFRAHVGATAALSRELYRAAGGVDASLRLGEDSEFGYRLAQAGAVFVPEPTARSWHLGPSSMMRDGAALRRYNRPFLADAMPQPRWLRNGGAGRGWRVPLVQVAVTADGPLEQVRECVDRLLASDLPDLSVSLVADWDALAGQPRRVLDDPLLDRRLLAATYRHDPRVRLVGSRPGSAFPSPYLLTIPARLGVGRHTVRRLIDEADHHRVGLLQAMPQGAGAGPTPPVAQLWRTAAVSRARRSRRPGEPLAAAVTDSWGGRWVNGDPLGLIELPPEAGPADPAAPGPGAGTPAGVGHAGTAFGGPRGEVHPVPVAGVRSLLRAAGLVVRLAAGRVRGRLRTP